MIKFKLITENKIYEITSENYFIIKENKYEESRLVESILFESNNECVNEITILDFYELYEFENGWKLIDRYEK